MAQITINGRELEKQFSPDSTIDSVANFLVSDGSQVLVNVSVDGSEVSPEHQDAVFMNNIEGHQEINFTTQSKIELALEAIDSSVIYINHIIHKISVLINLYEDGRVNDANTSFGDIIETMDLFTQLIAHICKTIKENSPNKFIKSAEMTNLEIHLVSTLRALIPAKEKNDIVMLCDLLEYELVDNLTEWKKIALPELKNSIAI